MEPDTGKNPAEEALAKTPAPPKQPKKTANMQKQGLVSEGALKRAKKKLGVKDTDGDGEVDHGEDAPKPKNSKADNAIEGKVAVTNADDDD